LSLGDFEQGWKKYEYGKFTTKKDRITAKTPYTPWNGESLNNKTILITAEQGVGDEIMFASCIPDVINQCPKQIIVECDSRLAPLFKRSFSQIITLERKERNKADWLKRIDKIDFHVSIGSLPKNFRQSISSFPSRRSFLTPDSMIRNKWKKRYNELGEGMKIGFSWTGGAKGSNKRIVATTLKQWMPLFRMNAYFINLQYGEHSEELQQLEESTGIHIYDWEDADPLTNLDNQAAQISELDLVISFPNTAVHLAGSVGTPTWVLLPFTPDFRWISNREDSPWYSKIRLFKQHQYGDWASVFSKVENELDVLIRQVKHL
jgi:ADP-heptose:LPS heptosyltransferase